ncbi:histidine ammonia-lyase [Paraburkholderia sp. RL18-103-BIB-C]|uniref:histidine ammonia-lyase n=1 Tax=unclassified Paraburkholderia TaxID=2615204 RepID=UPI0038BCF6FB
MHIHPKLIREVVLGERNLSVAEFVAVARYDAIVVLSDTYRKRVRESRSRVERFLNEDRRVYGVTTGFGDNVTRLVSPAEARTLQRNIVRSHAVSVGTPLEPELVRAIQLAILNSLGKGFSGVRLELLEQIAALLNNGVVPYAPGEGSVGYLAPEAHLALVLIGEGKAYVDDKLVSGAEALESRGLKPLELECKEGLALINGTTSVTGIATLSLFNATEASRVADVTASMSLEALRGTVRAFDARYHAVKAHPEQAQTARVISALLESSVIAKTNIDYRLQDTYSLRAIPQVHGAGKKTISDARASILNELASCGDNPVVYPLEEDGIAISGANFDGTYVGIACDTLCIAMTNLAKISERRCDRMMNAHFSELPAFLVDNPGLNSGFMIAQYTAAGLLGEMKILSHPASVDSVSTCANQEDPVSFAYGAAVKAYRISNKLSYVIAIELMAALQAIDFHGVERSSLSTRAVHQLIRSEVRFLAEDRFFQSDIEFINRKVTSGEILAIASEAAGIAL